MFDAQGWTMLEVMSVPATALQLSTFSICIAVASKAVVAHCNVIDAIVAELTANTAAGSQGT